MYYEKKELFLEAEEMAILKILNNSKDKALESFKKANELEYHSTNSDLYFRLDIPGLEGICVKTVRLNDLMTHKVAFDLPLYASYEDRIERLRYGDGYASINLKTFMYGLESGFSYTYEFGSNTSYIKEWKELNESAKKYID